MHNRIEQESKLTTSVEYVVVGGGPAGICAIAKLCGSGVPGKKIIWVDPEFKVGDFGTKLSEGSSVPGNTAVESYQKVNSAICTMIPECNPTAEEKAQFEMAALSPDTTCSLRVAAQPLRNITKKLRQLVYSIEGTVLAIQETKDGIGVDVKSTNGKTIYVLAKRVVLAVGAEPKTMLLPNHITTIDPNVVFIKSELEQYLNKNPGITKVAVIGSSHSAALATMHLLQAGVAVEQFRNKEYKFATPSTAPDGTRYTQFDNTGLKGEVGVFTRKLLNDRNARKMWASHTAENIDALLATHLSKCTHAVVCIGYKLSSSLQINGLPLAEFKYDKYSTQIMYANGRPVSGVFGIGVAFPLEVQAISGEVEFAVGVGKFWASLSNKTLSTWKNHPAGISPRYNGIFRSVPQQALYNGVPSHQIKAKL